MTIYDIIAKAEALRKETALGAISPERVGRIQTETLKYLNEAQIFADSLVHKIYANETAFLNDSERISDLTGRPMVAGQLLFIQNPGQFWRYDGDDRRTLIGDSIYKSDWLANEGEAGYVKNRTHYFRRSDLYTVPNTGRGAFAEVLHLNDYTKIYHASLNRIIDISYDGQEHIVSSDPYFAYKVVDGGYLYVSSDIVTSLAIVLSVTKLSEHYIPDTIARTDALDSLEEKVELVDENLQTQLESHDVAIEDLQDNKVDKGDYAPALTAGFADNLVSKDMVVDSEFNLRRSGGGAISDGVARMEVVKGNSVVWNQQLRPLSSTEWYNNPTYASSEYSDNYCKLTVVQEESALQANGVAITATTTNRKSALPNHFYLITAEIKVSVAISVGIRNFTSPWGGDYRKNAQANQWTRVAYIDKPTELYNGYAIVGTTTNIGLSVGDTIEIRNVAVVDLTQMFGAGNEPTTIEEFYARKPIVEDEYAYNEGEVIHCNVDAVKSVGRNVWDEEWELGALYGDTDDRIRSSYIKVLPNTQYFFRCSGIGGYFDCFEYDEDKNYVRNTGGIFYNGRYTTSPIAQYLRFALQPEYGTTYNHDICINLSDPDFNGQYEPYKEDVRELPSAIKEVFPNGMMSAGTAHDVAYNDLNKEVGVTEKRIGVVDLGIQNWGQDESDNTRFRFDASTLKMAFGKNLFCVKYPSAGTFTPSLMADKTVCVSNSPTLPLVRIKDSAYTDVASFKAAMAGVLLYYELAEPIVTEHQEPFNLDYQVTNGGQEQAMATEPTSAFKAEISYGFNASAKIKENANEIAQLKATIAQLQAALASMVNANVEDYE